MKKVLLLSIILLAVVMTNSVFGQTTDTTSKVKFSYCDLTTIRKAFSSTVTIVADFGQESMGYMKDKRVKDELTGKLKSFLTAIDALNYMGNQGWELVQVYTLGTDVTMIHWVLKKKIE